MALRDKVWEHIDELNDRLWETALKIHENPELGFEEYQAAAWMTEILEQGGFSVERGVAGLPTAFRAVHPASSPGPTIAILCEYDALPQIGHACGHNLMAMIGVGAGLGLAPFKSELPGRLLVIGTPAEEAGGGKGIMVRAGVFADVDAAMITHPGARTLFCRGSLAVQTVKMSFHGKAAHASSRPEEGINALDAAIQTFNGLNALRQHIRDGARVHGIITHGGERPNIVPEYAAAEFYVRAAQNDYCEELVEKLKNCARGGALAAGAEVKFDLTGHMYKALNQNRTMAEVWGKYATELGYPNEEYEGGLGSTDMGDVSWEVPGIHPSIRISDHPVAGHSRDFAEASRSELARKGMIAAAKAEAALAIDLFQDPALMERVKAEFAASKC